MSPPIVNPDPTRTRRTILRTGAKLAYAAPLVAASVHFGARGAGAGTVVSGDGARVPEPCGPTEIFDPVACRCVCDQAKSFICVVATIPGCTPDKPTCPGSPCSLDAACGSFDCDAANGVCR